MKIDLKFENIDKLIDEMGAERIPWKDGSGLSELEIEQILSKEGLEVEWKDLITEDNGLIYKPGSQIPGIVYIRDCWNDASTIEHSPEDGPKLPFTAYAHCMVQVDSTSIYLIGGWQDKKKSEKTWIIDAKNNFAIKEGPPMYNPRCWHSSATMRLNNKVFIIVVGGYGLKSHTEILDTSLPTNKWRAGKKKCKITFTNTIK